MFSDYSEFLVFISALLLLVALVIIPVLVVFLAIILPISIVKGRYKKFVLKHSVALRQLNEINKHYQFKEIPNFDMDHSYDNENFYEDISCRDYLTYQLIYIQKKVNVALKDTLDNKNLFDKYIKDIESACIMDKYDTPDLLSNRKRLAKYEKNLFEKQIKAPSIFFFIRVRLELTTYRGNYRRSKHDEFNAKEIKYIITKLNQKRGSYYLDNDIWQSICRVERGKVTNKMRFAVYERDHNRCRKCGSRTNLEVDHIYPISKGGKSTFDNLQTLCHRCNYNKGANIE
ncbi:MAG: HNH endonuclease [Bacilli bacterium]|nr:HNH endonuclease [Bacilli bacterium]